MCVCGVPGQAGDHRLCPVVVLADGRAASRHDVVADDGDRVYRFRAGVLGDERRCAEVEHAQLAPHRIGHQLALDLHVRILGPHAGERVRENPPS